ncbi:MAG: beta-hexosaminidase, partial [Boseongicola sp.]|nr:beta-hexosaminidase [Boseongicola sp.]
AEGLLDSGCLTVLKHAPGHGRAKVDSHKDLPRYEVPLAALEATDFAPFRALADTGMAMTAHIVVPEIDAERPITQSQAGISYLRQKLGLTGLLMSDDISMNALAGDVVSRGQAALAAGCDLVLHCNGDRREMEAISDGLGRMGPAAAKRADIALAARRTTRDIDIPAFEAEFEALMQGA